MKYLLMLSCLALNSTLLATEYLYQVEEKDQLGIILLSLGHKRIWSKDGQTNLFKKKFHLKTARKIYENDILKINDQDILFKKNVIINNKSIKFITKVRTLDQYEELLKRENLSEDKLVETESVPALEVVKKEESQETKAPEIQSFNLYPGIGAFVTNDSEKDRQTSSSTFSGLQPLVQLKGIYSNTAFGSLAIDLMAKKIINDKFSFPVNTDYRIQLIPKWNFTDYFRFAVSHSMIAHSYVGKSTSAEVAYKLKSNFIGFGIVMPREHFWFEFFFEKAYSGKTTSLESSQEGSKGFRIDSELVYPISKIWRLIPGINYYQLKQNSTDYSLSVIEIRSVLARSFEF